MKDRPIYVDGLNASWHIDPKPFAHLIDGNVNLVNATVAACHDTTWTLDTIGRVLAHISTNADRAMIVDDVDAIERAVETGRLGYILGFQDTEPIGDKLHLIEVFYRIGVRIMQLTYNFENRSGCGCRCETDTGLTSFGTEVIGEINRLGILLDLSHTGLRTSMDAISASTAPVALTHANLLSTRDNPRNKPTELVKAIAETGGVVGAVAFPPLLAEGGTGTIDDYLAAVDGLVELIGVRHVGLGPDFMEAMPADVAATVLGGLPSGTVSAFTAIEPLRDFADPSGFPRLAEALLRRGYTEGEMRAVMGGNWIALYTGVWSRSRDHEIS